MDSARQVIRWSMPGWTFLFSLVSLQIATSLYWASSPAAFVAGPLALISPGVVALIVGSGIPLGFLIYQLYYFLYGNIFPFNIVSRDRGAEVIQRLPDPLHNTLGISLDRVAQTGLMCEAKMIPLLNYPIIRLRKEFRHRDGRTTYRNQVHENWEAVRFLLHLLCLKNSSFEIRNEVTTLADIYHGIGASRIAILLSVAVHFSFNILRKGLLLRNMPLQVLQSIVLPYLVVYAVLVVLEGTRRHSLNSLQAFLCSTVGFFFSSERSVLGLTSPTLVSIGMGGSTPERPPLTPSL